MTLSDRLHACRSAEEMLWSWPLYYPVSWNWADAVIVSGAELIVFLEAKASPQDAKQIYLQGQRLANKDLVQPNWGRVLGSECDDYSRGIADADASLEDELYRTFQSYQTLFSVPHHGTARFEQCSLPTRFLKDKRLESTSNPPSSVVLEELEGFVEQIEGSTAYVRLRNEKGERLFGEYPAAELKALGIEERRRFLCKTVETDGEVSVVLEPISAEVVSPEEETEISRRIDELLADDDLDDDD